MIKAKKYLAIVSAVVLMSTVLFTLNTYAEEQGNPLDYVEKIINENDTYIQHHYIELFNQELSEDEDFDSKIEQISAVSDTGQVESIFALSYIVQDEQLIEGSGDTDPLYVQTKVTALSNTRLSGDQGVGNFDQHQYVYLYSRMYYSYKSIGSGVYSYKMTRVTGSYSIQHANIGVPSQYVWYGQNSSSVPDNEEGSFNPTSTSWSKNTNFNNYCFGGGYGVMGVHYRVKIKNYTTGSSWNFTLYNTKSI